MTAILGFTQLSLRKLPPCDPVYKISLRSEKSANRGSEVTQKLLAFSRRQHLDRRVINLNESISEILKLLNEYSAKILPSLSFSRLNWRPSADPAQIEQIIMNLSLNARDAMPKGGRLMIERKTSTLTNIIVANTRNVFPEGTFRSWSATPVQVSTQTLYRRSLNRSLRRRKSIKERAWASRWFTG